MPSRAPVATEAFPLWLELTGVDPAQFAPMAGDEEPQSRSYTLESYDATQTAVGIFDALALNDGELTAQLLLTRSLDEHMAESSFTLADLVNTPELVQAPLNLCQQIRAILNRPPLVSAREAFAASLHQALVHYASEHREDVREIIESPGDLALLRRDALGSLQNLRQSQFLQGATCPLSRPQYSTVIRRWWSVDHLLAAHTAIPEGVSLNLVSTPQAHDTFFCFVVRRGANLYLLDDASDYAHPLQSQMSRRPDRRMADRIAKFWFPYDLAEVVVDEDGRSARVRPGTKQATALDVVGKPESFSRVIGTVADLPAPELLWLVMMFDLIVDKYWSDFQLPPLELSYTATQLKPEGQLLTQAAQAAGLPVVASPLGTHAVPELTVSVVSSLHLQPDAEETLGNTGPVGHVEWMSQRYGHQVPDEVLNHVSSGDDLLRLTKSGQVEVVEGPDRERLESDRFFGRDTSLVALHSMEPTTIGTAKQLAADRAFLARHNYACALEALAKREFGQRREEVEKWLDDAYAKRVDFLLSLVPTAQAHALRVVDWKPGEGPDTFEFKKGLAVDSRFGHQVGPSVREADRGCSHAVGIMCDVNDRQASFVRYLAQGHERRPFKALCHVTGSVASYFLLLRPSNAHELAWLLGLEVSELPDVLQHLGALVPSAGNSILNRIDPMLWAVDNPWHQLDIGARLGVSKRGLAKLQKDYPDPVSLAHLDGISVRMLMGSAEGLA